MVRIYFDHVVAFDIPAVVSTPTQDTAIDAIQDIDFDYALAENVGVSSPIDRTAIMSGRVDDSEPFFSAAQEKGPAGLVSSSVRAEYHEVLSIRSAARPPAPVPAVRILARLPDALPKAEFAQHSKRHSSHVCAELYGYVHWAGLAVVKAGSGSWDSKRRYGTI